MIRASVIADSIWAKGPRLTTLQLEYPRLIHAEMNTHRALSKSASSSRALPTSKMLERVLWDPAMPARWGRNQKGMQAYQSLEGWALWVVRNSFLLARFPALFFAWVMLKAGAAKQVANRILEPWCWIQVVVTSTDWANFFALRLHHAADPTFQALALEMRKALDASTPRVLQEGDWHLPYVGESRAHNAPARSAARCGRVSYNKHDGTAPSEIDDMRTFHTFVGSAPVHASPTEHPACALMPTSEERSNFRGGWVQLRKMIPNECVKDVE